MDRNGVGGCRVPLHSCNLSSLLSLQIPVSSGFLCPPPPPLSVSMTSWLPLPCSCVLVVLVSSVSAIAILYGVHDAVGQHGHLARHSLHPLFELSNVWPRRQHTLITCCPCVTVTPVPKQVSRADGCVARQALQTCLGLILGNDRTTPSH